METLPSTSETQVCREIFLWESLNECFEGRKETSSHWTSCPRQPSVQLWGTGQKRKGHFSSPKPYLPGRLSALLKRYLISSTSNSVLP